MYKTIDRCRGCGQGPLLLFGSLGNQYVVDFVKEKLDNALQAPLQLVRCLNCNLVQLQHSVTPDRLYRKFWYRSSVNESMRAALRDLAVCAYNSVAPLKTGDRVLDIGCNDGQLLLQYPSRLMKVGIDPCGELIREAADHGVDVTINNYFSKGTVAFAGPYRIITAAAMFYDVENPLEFLEDCRDVLAEEGVLVVQMNYLKTMLENCAVDNISHEHLAYYSVSTFENLVNKAGLEIQGVEENAVNGGSFRAYITHPGKNLHGFSVDKQVGLHAYKHKLLLAEQMMELHTDAPYQAFAARAEETLQVLRDYIHDRMLMGCKFYVYGASTRGSTLLQCLNMPEGTFIAAAERDEHKFGLMTVGTWIPIKPEKECREDASMFFVLPYHFREAILKREEQFLANAGELLFPLPVPQVVSYEGELNLLPARQEVQ